MSLFATRILTLKRLQKLVLATATVLLVFAGMASTAAWSRTVLDLDVQQQPVALKDWGDYWIDTTGQMTAERAFAANPADWKPTQSDAIYPVKSGQSLWIRFTVPPAPDAERWYLEVPYPSINRATLYTFDSAGQWGEQKSGDLVAVSSWPVPHRHPLLPIAVSAETPSSYLLRLENGHSFGTQLRFLSESHLNHSEQRMSLILGIFFGLVGLAAVVSALSALSLRDPAYGFYAASVTLMGLTQASSTGIAGLHLWPNLPGWNDVSTSVLPTLELTATLMFVSAAVSLPERSARLHRLFIGIAVLGLVTAVAVALVPIDVRMRVLMSYVFLPQLLALSALVWAWQRGDRFAPWLILGFAPVAIAAACISARNLGWLPVSFLTKHASQIGAAIELPILMVILMLRSQQHRENKRRILGLDRVDPATGLINGHVFAERLIRMMARSERLRQQSAVMLIDIVNSEQIERDFGRKTAEELPLRVAERLLSTAREIDSAARLSERRFGMLVEGPFDAEDAGALGPRIVARCLMPYKGLHMDCTAQVRVAYALLPHQSTHAQSLLTRLEERLAWAASTGDKRAVFMLIDTFTPTASAKA
ncbi:MAG: 7TM diverse intracellular signaling domain-containing protein [Polaromonas sp.]